MRLLVTMKLGDTVKLKNGLKGFLGIIVDHIYIGKIYRSFVIIQKKEFIKVSFEDVSWSTVGFKRVLTEKINTHVNLLCFEGKIIEDEHRKIIRNV